LSRRINHPGKMPEGSKAMNSRYYKTTSLCQEWMQFGTVSMGQTTHTPTMSMTFAGCIIAITEQMTRKMQSIDAT
jgi:hypothetical protein